MVPYGITNNGGGRRDRRCGVTVALLSLNLLLLPELLPLLPELLPLKSAFVVPTTTLAPTVAVTTSSTATVSPSSPPAGAAGAAAGWGGGWLIETPSTNHSTAVRARFSPVVTVSLLSSYDGHDSEADDEDDTIDADGYDGKCR